MFQTNQDKNAKFPQWSSPDSSSIWDCRHPAGSPTIPHLLSLQANLLPVSCLGKSAIWMCNRAALLDTHYKLTWPKEWAENWLKIRVWVRLVWNGKKMTVGRTVYLINQNQNPTNSTWDVPTATGEINPMVEFLPTQTLVVLLRRSLSCWNFSDGLFRWILGANRLTQHQK